MPGVSSRNLSFGLRPVRSPVSHISAPLAARMPSPRLIAVSISSGTERLRWILAEPNSRLAGAVALVESGFLVAVTVVMGSGLKRLERAKSSKKQAAIVPSSAANGHMVDHAQACPGCGRSYRHVRSHSHPQITPIG